MCASQDSWGLQNIVETWASEVKVTQSCPTLGDPMDYSWPGPSIHGMLQARILEWVAISFSKGSSQPRDRTQRSPTLQADSLSELPGKRLRQVSLKTAELSGNVVLWGRAEGERWQTRGTSPACECADTSLPGGHGQDPTLSQERPNLSPACLKSKANRRKGMENISSVKRPGSPFILPVLLSQSPNPTSSLGGQGGEAPLTASVWPEDQHGRDEVGWLFLSGFLCPSPCVSICPRRPATPGFGLSGTGLPGSVLVVGRTRFSRLSLPLSRLCDRLDLLIGLLVCCVKNWFSGPYRG